MAKKHPEITSRLKRFIEAQKLFFVGTAAAEGRVNVSPKGMDTLRVVGKDRVVWLNLTGSGNETSAHVQDSPRMTIMFTSFEGAPMVLRLYGTAKVVHMSDPEWKELYSLFGPRPGARQIFDLAVDLVTTSCGMSVPFFDYTGERKELENWALKKGDKGLREYWGKANRVSIDNRPTNIMEKNAGRADVADRADPADPVATRSGRRGLLSRLFGRR